MMLERELEYYFMKHQLVIIITQIWQTLFIFWGIFWGTLDIWLMFLNFYDTQMFKGNMQKCGRSSQRQTWTRSLTSLSLNLKWSGYWILQGRVPLKRQMRQKLFGRRIKSIQRWQFLLYCTTAWQMCNVILVRRNKQRYFTFHVMSWRIPVKMTHSSVSLVYIVLT